MLSKELQVLRTEVSQAFEAKQHAYQEMDIAGKVRAGEHESLEMSWKILEDSRHDMNFEYEKLQSDWDDYKSQAELFSHDIIQATDTAGAAHMMMKIFFKMADEAAAEGDEAKRAEYVAEAVQFKNGRDETNAEKAELIKARKALRKPNDEAYKSAKARYETQKMDHKKEQDSYAKAKREHEEAKRVFNAAKDRYDRLVKHYRAQKKMQMV